MDKDLNIGGLVIKHDPNMSPNMGMFIPDKPSFLKCGPDEDPMVKFVEHNNIVTFTLSTPIKPEE